VVALLLALPTASDAGLFGRKRSKKPKTSIAAPAQVVGIVVEPLPDGLRLQIDCSSRVRFRWSLDEDTRTFHVDLDGAQIAETLRQIMVGEIRTEAIGRNQVRISMGLREGVKARAEPSKDGRSLTLRLQSAEPIVLEPQAPTTLPPVADRIQRLPREPSPAPPSPPTLSKAGVRVTSLEIENLAPNEAVLRVRMEGRLASWRPFRLDSPPRLVVDLKGAEHSVASAPRYRGTGPLTLGSVVSAQFSREPLVTRIVVHVPRNTTPYAIEPPDVTGELRVRVGGAAAAVAVPTPAMPPVRFRGGLHVGIDPGHGGSDPGAINTAVGVTEKEITLDISRRLARILERAGVKTSMTRSDDRRLQPSQRITFVSDGEANVFVSIHCDAREGRPDYTGITTYFHGERANGRELATAIQAHLPDATDLPDRGVRSDFRVYNGQGFYVLRNARMPAVLIECGYVSHAPTARNMAKPEFRQQVAQGIAEGLRKYWEEQRPRGFSAALPDDVAGRGR
jgi:N-acetylmuramoyl-L-alanine amidase